MKICLAIFLILGLILPGQGFAQDQGDESPDEPLSITIRPEYDKFNGIFSDGSAANASRIETRGLCPPEQILSCDITSRFWGSVDKTKAVIAAFAYEKQKADWRAPSLALLMGRRYAGKPDYLILAAMGVDPGLKPLHPWPQPEGQLYGSMWFGDSFSLADRMAGPIMLTKGGPTQTELLNGDDGIFTGF